MNKHYYLKNDVMLDPLYHGFYVTLPMFAPAQLSMMFIARYLPILRSFVKNPELHLNAAHNPKLYGGPYIPYSTSQVDIIKLLINEIEENSGLLLSLYDGFKQLYNMLVEKTDGKSMVTLYSEIPEPIREFVELYYDIFHHPSFRIIEPILYKKNYINKNYMSLYLSKLDGERPFVLSTPRLDNYQSVNLRVSFDDPIVDMLFSARFTPVSVTELSKSLNIPDDKQDIFCELFSEDPPHVIKFGEVVEDKIYVNYFGHACLLIRSANTTILVDPLLAYRDDENGADDHYSISDLPPVIDYVLITHGHLDHIVLESLLQIRHRVKCLVVPKSGLSTLIEPSLKLLLTYLGFNNVIEVDEFDQIIVNGGCVTSIPFIGEHHDLQIRTKNTYLIRLNGKSIFIGVDTQNINPDLYSFVGKQYGAVDMFFISVECDGAPLHWFYGHLIPAEIDRSISYSRKGNASNALQAFNLIEALHAKSVYVYAMGMEPWLKYILTLNLNEDSVQIKEANKLIEICRGAGIYSELLYLKKEIYL